MAIIDKFCPKCMNLIKKKDEKCSKCGMLVKNMQKYRDKQAEAKIKVEEKAEEKPVEKVEEELVNHPVVIETNDGGAIVDTSKMFNKEQKEKVSIDKTQETEYDEDLIGTVVFEDKKPKRHKHKKKNKSEQLDYTVDEDGSYNINTKDVTYLEGVEKPTSSIRKARGDLKEEKIEWWEIYKWADKMLARRKIKKEVSKASTKIPAMIKRSVMMTYCFLFGWLGIHNFYAGNKKKGWFVVCADIIIMPVINIPVLYKFMGVFVGGGLGFVVMAMWFLDMFGIIFNKYKYRISKEEFISNLNVETRAKLGKKYINFDKKVFKEKEESRLNKKANKKQRKLDKKKRREEKKALRQRNKEEKSQLKTEKKAKKVKQKTDYEIIEHKMDE